MGGPGSGRKKGGRKSGFGNKSNPRAGYEKTGTIHKSGKNKMTAEKGYYGVTRKTKGTKAK